MKDLNIFVGPLKNHVQRARWQFLIGFQVEPRLEITVIENKKVTYCSLPLALV